jgi:hypothetical protein
MAAKWSLYRGVQGRGYGRRAQRVLYRRSVGTGIPAIGATASLEKADVLKMAKARVT